MPWLVSGLDCCAADANPGLPLPELGFVAGRDRGAAGWRMDVAPWVPDDFWREWRQAVKQTRPDAITIAETWFDASKYFLGDTFDSTMNYVLRNALLETPSNEADRIAQERMKGMHDLIELMMTWFDDVQRMDPKTLSQLMKLGSKVGKLLAFTNNLKVVGREE